MIKRGFKVVTYILTVALFYSWKFLLNSARSHWLLRGHMKLFPAKISERGNNAKKSRRQRVTISSYTTHHLKTGASGICFPGDQSLSDYYCCDRCWWWHKTSTDNLVDCYPGSGIHQNLVRGMWDFFPSLSGTRNHDDSDTRSCGKCDLTRQSFSCVPYQLSKIYIVIWLIIV